MNSKKDEIIGVLAVFLIALILLFIFLSAEKMTAISKSITTNTIKIIKIIENKPNSAIIWFLSYPQYEIIVSNSTNEYILNNSAEANSTAIENGIIVETIRPYPPNFAVFSLNLSYGKYKIQAIKIANSSIYYQNFLFKDWKVELGGNASTIANQTFYLTLNKSPSQNQIFYVDLQAITSFSILFTSNENNLINAINGFKINNLSQKLPYNFTENDEMTTITYPLILYNGTNKLQLIGYQTDNCYSVITYQNGTEEFANLSKMPNNITINFWTNENHPSCYVEAIYENANK